ncbi:MAG TPA: hypothetical protein IGS37_15960 [Synechococcales cyanobacterium M55_K2018_004]|nr:hypothetical protein [Synechococcales cyanobacterium M55_K2018_004]
MTHSSSEPLKVMVPVTADTAEAAIADLADRFLRHTSSKVGYRMVNQPTEFSLASLCHQVIQDWQSGKLAFEPGEITLVFSGGKLAPQADLIIFRSINGWRHLYTSPQVAPPQAQPTTTQCPLPLDTSPLDYLTHQMTTLSEALAQLTDHQRSVERRLRELFEHHSREERSPHAAPLPNAADVLQSFQELLDLRTTELNQQLSSQLTAAILHLNERLNKVQTQLDQITRQLELTDDPPIPQNQAEWQQRIQAAWGTVGDYEQYSASHREMNAETPLFFPPDWVALCELDWARSLHPALATLHTLIHQDNGIGYAGADILQQFGCHLDPRTGDRYYIYQLGGYTAYDALWKTVHHPQHSWLPELRRLSQRLASHPEIFEMFGWEQEAIAALGQVVEQATRQQQASQQAGQKSYQAAGQSGQRTGPQGSYRAAGVNGASYAPGNTLTDYLSLLNLGPFTPLTVESIKRAYKQAMKAAHPDTGGSKEQAQRVNEAYEAILRHYFPHAI